MSETAPTGWEVMGGSLSRLVNGFAKGVELLTKAPGFLLDASKDALTLTKNLWDTMTKANPEENLLIYMGLPSHSDIEDLKEREKAVIADRLGRLQEKLQALQDNHDFMVKYYESASLLTTIKLLEAQKSERIAQISRLKAQRASIVARKDFSTTPPGVLRGGDPGDSAADRMMAIRTANLAANTELTTVNTQIAQLEKLNACEIPWPEFEFDAASGSVKEKALPTGKTEPETKNLRLRFNEISSDITYQRNLGELQLYLKETERNTNRLTVLNRPFTKAFESSGDEDGLILGGGTTATTPTATTPTATTPTATTPPATTPPPL